MPERPGKDYMEDALGRRIAELEAQQAATGITSLIVQGTAGEVADQVQASSDPASWLDQQGNVLQLRASIFDAANRFGGLTSQAVQAACVAAEAEGGGIVWMRAGEWEWTSPVVVPAGVQLWGVGWLTSNGSFGVGTATPSFGTTILVDDQGFVPITLVGNGAVVRNLAIYHIQDVPNGGWSPRPYPFAFDIRAMGCLVEDIFLLNATRGIRMDIASPDPLTGSAGRNTVRRVLGQPLEIGIDIDNAMDVVRIEDVHFWPFWANAARQWQYDNAVAIRSGRNDNPHFRGCFALGYGTGFEFVDGPTSKFYITDCDMDGCKRGIDITGENTTGQISNFNHQCDPVFGAGGESIRCSVNAVILAENVRSVLAEDSAILFTEGSFLGDNLWIENWNQSGAGLQAIRVVSPANARIGFIRRFNGGGGAAQTGGGGTIDLDS